MGPGFVRRDVPSGWSAPCAKATALQWGPASFAGMCTDRRGQGGSHGLSASMGPGFVRRDVLDGTACRALSGVPALQWGPASFAGMCSTRRRPPGRPGCGFNGARLRSPGCAWPRSTARAGRCRRRGWTARLQWGPASFAGMCRIPHTRRAPSTGLQWGPASFAGMCDDDGVTRRGRGAASMGPGFVRRDVPMLTWPPSSTSTRLQWGPASFAGMCRPDHPLDPHAERHQLQWGPASFAGMCHRRERSDGRRRPASMGPGFVRRDVPLGLLQSQVLGSALQWGPASFAGMCSGCVKSGTFRCPGLQWGPASFAGMCGRYVDAGAALRIASMGPGFVRRDVQYGNGIGLTCTVKLQWGPASFAGMCPERVRPRLLMGHASMGPGFVRRDVPRAASSLACACRCFNGARLRSPGCAVRGPWR